MKKLAMTAAVIGVLTVLSHAEVDRTQRPAAGPLPEVRFPKAEQRELENGLKLFIVESDRQPTVTFRLLIKGGGTLEGEKAGLAEITAALLNKGTEKRTAEQFARETDRLGATVEASATKDALYVVGSGLAKHAKAILDLMSDAVLRPIFPEEQLEKEKKKALAALETERKEPDALAAKLRNRLLFATHPYGISPTEETVSSITRADVEKFRAALFVPGNATMAVVGDVKAEELTQKVRQTFGGWEKGEAPVAKLPEFPEVRGISIHLVDRPGSVQSNIIVAAPGVSRSAPELPEIGVVNSILGGGFSGRLFQNLREKNAWTYGAYSGFSPQKHGGSFTASTEVRNEVTGQAVAEMLVELKRLSELTEDELALHRRYNAGNYLLSLESEQRNAERVQEIEFFGLPGDFYDTFAEKVMGVDVARAEELVKSFFPAENLVVVVVGEASAVKPQLEKLGSVTIYDTDLKQPSAP